MDADLRAKLDNILERDGVTGVLLADEQGLCLGAKGTAKKTAAAFITSLARHARDMSLAGEPQDKSHYPTVSVEYEHSKVIIRNEGAFTLAIFMELSMERSG